MFSCIWSTRIGSLGSRGGTVMPRVGGQTLRALTNSLGDEFGAHVTGDRVSDDLLRETVHGEC